MSYETDVIAELRRSAREDVEPWNECSNAASREAVGRLLYPGEFWDYPNSPECVSVFFLLIAESLAQ